VPQPRLQAFFRTIRDGTMWLQPDGPQGPMPRKTAWMVRPGCKCGYRYGGVLVEPQALPQTQEDPHCNTPQ
ncbi:eml4, partial [Symbiodinium pilosum]